LLRMTLSKEIKIKETLLDKSFIPNQNNYLLKLYLNSFGPRLEMAKIAKSEIVRSKPTSIVIKMLAFLEATILV
jgi:hypothetical protein